jgi:hypothetical protein
LQQEHHGFDAVMLCEIRLRIKFIQPVESAGIVPCRMICAETLAGTIEGNLPNDKYDRIIFVFQ